MTTQILGSGIAETRDYILVVVFGDPGVGDIAGVIVSFLFHR